MYNTFHIIHYKLYTIHHTLCTTHYIQHTIHYTKYTIHFTLYTIHYTLYTTLYITHYTLHTMYTIHYTQDTTQNTLYTTHYTGYYVPDVSRVYSNSPYLVSGLCFWFLAVQKSKVMAYINSKGKGVKHDFAIFNALAFITGNFLLFNLVSVISAKLRK